MLKGALVEVYFELRHFCIRKKNEVSFNSFNSSVQQVIILQPSKARPSNAYKRRNILEGLFWLNPSLAACKEKASVPALTKPVQETKEQPITGLIIPFYVSFPFFDVPSQQNANSPVCPQCCPLFRIRVHAMFHILSNLTLSRAQFIPVTLPLRPPCRALCSFSACHNQSRFGQTTSCTIVLLFVSPQFSFRLSAPRFFCFPRLMTLFKALKNVTFTQTTGKETKIE
jgi:hypothetical protein